MFHPIEQHGAIVEAIAAQDARGAVAVLGVHVSGAIQRIDRMVPQRPKLRRLHPDYFVA